MSFQSATIQFSSELVKNLLKVLDYYKIPYSPNVERQKTLCPFHADNNASLLIDFSTGTFHCFGCGCRGTFIEFIQFCEKCERLQATIIFYSKIDKQTETKNLNYVKSEVISDSQCLDRAKRNYEDYCVDSCISDEGIKYLLNRGFTFEFLKKQGVKNTLNKKYQTIFPIMQDGVFKGTVCRTEDKELSLVRKYLYNKGFCRRTTLFGNTNTSADYLVVTEGTMDMFKLKQFGLENSVAILGWKMTNEQAQCIRDKNIKCIISALDNTDTGIEGTEYLKTLFPKRVVRFKFQNECIKDCGDMDVWDFNYSWSKTKIDVLKVLNR